MVDVKKLWPSRYYAYAQADGSVACYDVWDMSTTDNVPDASDMAAMSAQQWADSEMYRYQSRLKIVDGDIVYKDAIPVTLASQASAALSVASSSVMQTYTIYGETTPDEWLTYLKILRAIANGTDTTSTALPAAPTS